VEKITIGIKFGFESNKEVKEPKARKLFLKLDNQTYKLIEGKMGYI